MENSQQHNEPETYILPEYWAPALINNDYSGITDDEEQQIKNFINREELKDKSCSGCSEEAYFQWRNDANNMGGNVLEYYFI